MCRPFIPMCVASILYLNTHWSTTVTRLGNPFTTYGKPIQECGCTGKFFPLFPCIKTSFIQMYRCCKERVFCEVIVCSSKWGEWCWFSGRGRHVLVLHENDQLWTAWRCNNHVFIGSYKFEWYVNLPTFKQLPTNRRCISALAFRIGLSII